MGHIQVIAFQEIAVISHLGLSDHSHRLGHEDTMDSRLSFKGRDDLKLNSCSRFMMSHHD
jgi:hypothetical protein